MELLAKREVLVLFGGINPSTLYRHIRKGTFPKPVKVGGSSRWLREECEAVLRSMVDGRAVS
jgi:predicted DNA-binding transcriptional regulator AlpA